MCANALNCSPAVWREPSQLTCRQAPPLSGGTAPQPCLNRRVVFLLFAIVIQVLRRTQRPIVIRTLDLDAAVDVTHAHVRTATTKFASQVASEKPMLRHR